MRGVLLGLLLLSVFMAISEVKSEERFVKLCGRDFVRAVVFICGGSRWRRHLANNAEGFFGEKSHPHISLDVSASATENNIQKPESQSEEFIQALSQSKGNVWSKQQRSILKRSEEVTQLTNSCCSSGCHESSIRSLC
ncbi:insulin-like peptide INSL5 [Eublepharis macularius]|uniref:Insulin-like peptide INSL5 n=1 Tax=Eublepharis macularius TaxID=481883 RepID=A0AA97JE63_EUBMA|nr:insulin-like peptide INSL5 [Eublepharis macularius]